MDLFDISIGNSSTLTNAYLAQTEASIRSAEAKTSEFEDTLNRAMENQDTEKLKEACREFESYFIQTLFKEMRKTVHSEDGVFPKSNAETMFQEMLDEEYAKNSTLSGGIGLADMMYKQMAVQMNIRSEE